MQNNEFMLEALAKTKINDYVGLRENAFLDGNYDECYGKQPVASIENATNDIVKDILASDRKYERTDMGIVVEMKHIRFMGEPTIRAKVGELLRQDYARDPWMFPHTK